MYTVVLTLSVCLYFSVKLHYLQVILYFTNIHLLFFPCKTTYLRSPASCLIMSLIPHSMWPGPPTTRMVSVSTWFCYRGPLSWKIWTQQTRIGCSQTWSQRFFTLYWSVQLLVVTWDILWRSKWGQVRVTFYFWLIHLHVINIKLNHQNQTESCISLPYVNFVGVSISFRDSYGELYPHFTKNVKNDVHF